MASTPTTILGFEKPASGDYTGAWAVPIDQVFDVIEDAITGQQSISSTGGDTTLSLTAYSADQARLAICRISVGQTLTSNVRILSLRKRKYLVSNESAAGAFTVRFGYDTSNLITIARGCCCEILIKLDGTVVQISPTLVLATGQVDSTSLTALYAKFPVATENIGCAVLSSTLATPPGSPSTGDRYIVPVGGLVAWTGHDAAIAVWDGAAWAYTAPAIGMLAWDRSNHWLMGYDAGGWQHGAITDPIPVGGITFMPFFQAAAPTGWTKSTAHNNKSIRIVSGTGGGSGGSVDYSTLFARTATDGHAVTVGEMPLHDHGGSTGYESAHTHGYDRPSGADAVPAGAGGGVRVLTFSSSNTGVGSAHLHAVGGQGGSSPHTHDIDMRLKYVDMIIASRD